MLKEIARKEFIKSMSKYYLGAFAAGTKYFLVTNAKGFDKSYMIVEPNYMIELFNRSSRMEDEVKATELKGKLVELRDRISDNSRKRAGKRWD
jgi:hypothetical protein